jgi:hypothetical protein
MQTLGQGFNPAQIATIFFVSDCWHNLHKELYIRTIYKATPKFLKLPRAPRQHAFVVAIFDRRIWPLLRRPRRTVIRRMIDCNPSGVMSARIVLDGVSFRSRILYTFFPFQDRRETTSIPHATFRKRIGKTWRMFTSKAW